jgi:hypothetical protein
MKRSLIALAFLLPLAVPHMLWAQQLVGFKAEKERVSIGEPVQLVLSLKQQRDLVWCGLHVDFGDGETRDVRVEQNPLTLTKQYHRAGYFMPKVEPKTLPRGLKTAWACDGNLQTASVQVVDPVAEAQSNAQRAAPPATEHERPPAVATASSAASAVGPKPIAKPPQAKASAPKDNYLKAF